MGEVEDTEPSEPSTVPRLLVWALSSFHTALLVAVVLAGLYATGVAGPLLAGLDTWVGVLAYLYLWGVTWWTNHELLDRIEGNLVVERPGPTALLADAMKWGGTAGVLVFVPPLLVGTVTFVAAGGLEAVPFLLLAGVTGVLLAAAVGVVVGTSAVLLDLLLLRTSDRWSRTWRVEAPDDRQTPD